VPRKTDYDLGNRSRAAIAVKIDHTLDQLLRKGADREKLWPLLYEYGAATVAEEPKPSIQAFVNGDIIEAGPSEWREVYYEDCPTPGAPCDSEFHHYGRGDHLVPVDPDWEAA
jgi:hypothetical protein